VIGFAGAILLVLLAIQQRSIWLGVLAFFILSQAQAGWRYAQNLALESEAAASASTEAPPPIPGQSQ
jgi:hypothetical protein